VAFLALLATGADFSGLDTSGMSPGVQTLAVVLMLIARIPEVRKQAAAIVKLENDVSDVKADVKSIRLMLTPPNHPFRDVGSNPG
jgi:hypothetical protein